MTERPLVSIIIPTYNRAHLIGETLDSVLAQTYKNWECIVVDDGSTDDTDTVMQEYCKKDARFKYYHRPEEHLPGGNGARNYGFIMSQGEYILWFDSDDLLKTNYLANQVTKSLKTKSDLCICEFEIFSNSMKNEFKFEPIVMADVLDSFILKRLKLCLPVILFHRKIVENIIFNEYLKKAQDFDFIYNVLISNNELTIIFNTNVLCSFRLHAHRISVEYKNFDKEMLLSSIKVKEKILLNEYFKLNETGKGVLLRQYISELKSLLYTFSYSVFFRKMRILKKERIINRLNYFKIITFSFYLASRQMILRKIKKIYSSIKYK